MKAISIDDLFCRNCSGLQGNRCLILQDRRDPNGRACMHIHEHYARKKKVANPIKAERHTITPRQNLVGQCPECSALLIYQEGCFICPACGYTRC